MSNKLRFNQVKVEAANCVMETPKTPKATKKDLSFPLAPKKQSKIRQFKRQPKVSFRSDEFDKLVETLKYDTAKRPSYPEYLVCIDEQFEFFHMISFYKDCINFCNFHEKDYSKRDFTIIPKDDNWEIIQFLPEYDYDKEEYCTQTWNVQQIYIAKIPEKITYEALYGKGLYADD